MIIYNIMNLPISSGKTDVFSVIIGTVSISSGSSEGRLLV